LNVGGLGRNRVTNILLAVARKISLPHLATHRTRWVPRSGRSIPQEKALLFL
jgi:hypothetical protein